MTKCQRLNSDGKRCQREATKIVTMHMDEQLYGNEPKWVIVFVCGHHGDLIEYKINDELYPVEDKNRINRETK